MIREPARGVTLFFAPESGAVVWSPENGGYRYTMLVSELGNLSTALSVRPYPSMFVSFAVGTDDIFVSRPIPRVASQVWTRDQVFRFWQRLHGIGAHAASLAMLLNWTLGGHDAVEYANTMWSNGMDAEVVNLGDFRGRSRKDS